MRSFCQFTAATLSIGLCTVALSQPPDTSDQSPLTADWPMEILRLSDGRQYTGLIESEDEHWVNFVQINRPAGKPMNLVIWPVERQSIAQITRLEQPQRDQLRRRIEQFVNRAAIEAARMQAVPLEAFEKDGRHWRCYQGRWFTLQSTVDESTARRMVVRMEQMFTAYRQVLPPRRQSDRPLRLIVFGSLEEYQTELDRLELHFVNRACFMPSENLVLAGSEVARFAAELSAVNARHEQLGRELCALEENLKRRLQELSRQLQKDGTAKRDTARMITAEKRKTQQQIEQKQKEIARCDRENQRLFDQVTARMFGRLYHEAFHAYLENYVYPAESFDVPAWLAEGLAVLFEGGLLEPDGLRIDAPQTLMLRVLTTDLRSPQPLALSTLLAAAPADFAVAPDEPADSSDRLYSHAWGLVYYLTFEKHLLRGDALDRYVEPPPAGLLPAARFQQLVDLPLEQFEADWHSYILRLSSR